MSDVLSALAELPKTRTAAALCTIIRAKGSTPRKEGCKMLVYASGSIVGTIGRAYDLIDPDKGDPGICGGTLEVFIDPLIQPEDLIVVGGGHVGKAVVYLAKWLGFRVILSDDREDFCSPDFVPGADEYIHCSLEELSSRIEFSPQSVIILATRNNQVDIRGLPELLAAPSAYIGVISSRRRWKLTEEELLKAGIKKKDLDRIHAPIGLDIKAETPEEIALSIMAEVFQVVRGGSGKGLS